MPEADGAVDRSILTVLRAATQRLSDAGIDSAARDARLLLVRGLGRTQAWFYANRGPVGVYKIYREIRNMRHVRKILDTQR